MLEDFGPYRIVRKIAVGGMAEIYLAREHGLEGLERIVVLKRILPTYVGDPEFVTMFLDEARLLAALSHPNIAQVFALGEIGSSYYLSMEYVRGPTLGAILQAAQRSPTPAIPQRAALGVALGVAQALAYVHARRDELGRSLGIVHRDLNPANVIVSYDGAVKLIDFGIAKAATKVYETRTGVIKGTYGYSAPEQLTKRGEVDHRADVFGVGVLLYEMCTGKHPFDASDEPSIIDRILNASYKRPREIVPGFPRQLDALIARCLSPHPEGRPDNIQAVMAEMVDFMSQRGIVPTMADLGQLANELVPDLEGARPLKPLTVSQMSRQPFTDEPSGTVEIRHQGKQAEVPDTALTGAPTDFMPEEATVRLSPRMAAEIEPPAREPDPTEERPRARSRSKMDPTWRVDSQVTAAPVEKKKTGRSRAMTWAASAILVLGVGVVAFITARAVGGRSTTEIEPSEPIVLSAADSATRVGEGGLAPSEAQDAGPAEEAEDLLLRIVSEPIGAQVFVNGQDMLAVTPTTVPVPASAESVWIRVSLADHVTQEREVQAAVDEARFVLMRLQIDAGPPEAEARSTKRRRRPRRRRPRARR